MAGPVRTRAVLRWPAVCAAFVGVLAVAGSAPAGAKPGGGAALYSQCRKAMQELRNAFVQLTARFSRA